MTADCLFCRIVSGEIPTKTVYESDTTLAFRDISPKAPTHVLVIPKQHYADVAELSAAAPEVARDMLATAAAVAESEGVAESGWRLLFNTGRHSGQEVLHVHGHVLGGRSLGPMIAPR